MRKTYTQKFTNCKVLGAEIYKLQSFLDRHTRCPSIFTHRYWRFFYISSLSPFPRLRPLVPDFIRLSILGSSADCQSAFRADGGRADTLFYKLTHACGCMYFTERVSVRPPFLSPFRVGEGLCPIERPEDGRRTKWRGLFSLPLRVDPATIPRPSRDHYGRLRHVSFLSFPLSSLSSLSPSRFPPLPPPPIPASVYIR